MRRNSDPDRMKKIMVYFIGFIMVSSVFGVIFLGFGSEQGENSLQYNGLGFTLRNNFWTVVHDDIPLSFVYAPQDVEMIAFDGNSAYMLKNAVEIDLTSDFNDTFAEGIALAQYQMGIVLQPYDKFLRQGFTSTQGNFQAITCKDSSASVPVIYFRKGNSTRLLAEENCIIAEAATIQDMIRVKDRIIYGMLGIIE